MKDENDVMWQASEEDENEGLYKEEEDREEEKSPRNEAAVKNETTNESKAVRVANSILVVACALTQVIVLLATLLGSVQIFGVSLDPVSAVDFVFKIFSIRFETAYMTLAKAAVAVCYVVAFVLMLKNAIASIAPCRRFFQKGSHLQADDLKKVYTKTANVTVRYIFMLIFVYVLMGGSLLGWAYAALAFGGAAYLYANWLNVFKAKANSLKSRDGILTFAIALLKPLFYGAAMIMLAVFMLQPSVKNISYGIPALSIGIEGMGEGKVIWAIYEYIIKDAIFTLTAIFYFRMAEEVLCDGGFGLYALDSKVSKKCLVFICISAALSCFLSAAFGGVETVSASVLVGWLSMLRFTFLPVIAVLVAILVVSKKDTFEYTV